MLSSTLQRLSPFLDMCTTGKLSKSHHSCMWKYCVNIWSVCMHLHTTPIQDQAIH